METFPFGMIKLVWVKDSVEERNLVEERDLVEEK